MSGERVEVLQTLIDLLCGQHKAITERDTDALLATLPAVTAAFGAVAAHLDTPPGPREKSLLRALRRLNNGNRQMLELLRQPLAELSDLARRHGVAAAVDQFA